MQPDRAGTAPAPPRSGARSHCLRLLLRQPEALYLLDRVLQKAGVSRFSVQDFEHADHQMLAAIILQSLEQDDMDANQYIQENLPETLQDLVRDLLAPFPQGEPTARAVDRRPGPDCDAPAPDAHPRSCRPVDFYAAGCAAGGRNLRLDDYQGIHQVVLQCTGS